MAWLGIWFHIFKTCGMWTNWVGQKTETNEEHDEDCVEKIVREAVQLLRWGIVVTIFEMEQN